jgi:hypothetical protein
MVTFPAGDRHPRSLPSLEGKSGPNLFVAESYPDGVHLELRLVETSLTAAASWLLHWFEGFVRRMPERDAAQEATFLNLIFDSRLSQGSEGQVTTSGSVQLFQFGCHPSGPPDGEEVALADLVRTVIGMLR